jgi:hypothetical protein
MEASRMQRSNRANSLLNYHHVGVFTNSAVPPLTA